MRNQAGERVVSDEVRGVTFREQDVKSARRLLSPGELASYLGLPVATIYRWRSRGDGPCGMRVGRHVRYRVEDVDRWLDDLREHRQ